MNNKKTFSARLRVFFTLVSMLAVCCLSSGAIAHQEPSVQANVSKSDYESAIKRAYEASTIAEQLEYRWTTLPELLSKAEQAAKTGDYINATALATEALKHAELSIAQARKQKENWRNSTLK